ncbi:MAG: leucine-rich repeat protein [Prevotella sp.]|nr:leucine-rich repeat protein [Prevotella sp.]
MNYPLISEYVEAIKLAEDNFEELNYLRPVLDSDGNPVMSSGNFAVVFKMQDVQSGKLYAVRCFHREQAGRAESYKLIEEELNNVSSPYLVSFRYIERELFVDSEQTKETEFPVLLMDWVEGVTLDKYLREHITDKYALEMLAYNFSQLAMWLMPQPFAHGDLKPDNILVRNDGSLVLVDYDGMFIPAMQGQTAREIGSPDFRHPQRTEDDFNERIDDFSVISILLSLKLIAMHPEYLDEYGASDRLLFSANDYADIANCQLLKAVFPSEDTELNRLASLFLLCHSAKNLANVSFVLFSVENPQERLSTKVTSEDLANAWVDEYGVEYSQDRKRLLRCTNQKIINYMILEGIEVICDHAFINCTVLKGITIPNSVVSIGKGAFEECSALNNITIPYSISLIDDRTFRGCADLKIITIPDSVTSIGKDTFFLQRL